MVYALLVVAAWGSLFMPQPTWAAQTCPPSEVTVQVLGSGGPRINPDRASSSYLLWIGDKARILVDIGGGAFLRFGQAQQSSATCH